MDKIKLFTGASSNPISTKKVGFNTSEEMYKFYGVKDGSNSPKSSAADEYRNSWIG